MQNAHSAHLPGHTGGDAGGEGCGWLTRSAGRLWLSAQFPAPLGGAPSCPAMGIGHCMIVDPRTGTIEVHSDPCKDRCQVRDSYIFSES
jgi:hypothetical protein